MTAVDRPADEPVSRRSPPPPPAESGSREPGGDGVEQSGRRRRSLPRRILRMLTVLLMLTGLYVGVSFVQVWHAAGQDQRGKVEAIVVLGAAQYDGRPSPILESRLHHALELYEEGVASVIVVTGGRQAGDRFTEATSGYNWLRDRGVPDSALRKEVKGRNTWESIAATARFLDAEGINRVVLVSSPSHAYRVRAVAREVGLEANISPVPHRGSGRGGTKLLVRETAAVSLGRIVGYRRLVRLVPSLKAVGM